MKQSANLCPQFLNVDQSDLSDIYYVVSGISDGVPLCGNTCATRSRHEKEKGQRDVHPKNEKETIKMP